MLPGSTDEVSAAFPWLLSFAWLPPFVCIDFFFFFQTLCCDETTGATARLVYKWNSSGFACSSQWGAWRPKACLWLWRQPETRVCHWALSSDLHSLHWQRQLWSQPLFVSSVVTSPQTHCKWHLGWGGASHKKGIRPQGYSLARKASQFFRCTYRAVL